MKIQMMDRKRAKQALEVKDLIDSWLANAVSWEAIGMKSNADQCLEHALLIETEAKNSGLFF